ncbi:MAG TPA: PadR family transcriptional regulator [Streptosporangiaceae bacterium]|nr:PadR family transcriptional regulator [Streptosporangiaceae bacterium]
MQMTAGAAFGACDLDAGLVEALKYANDVLGKIRGGIRAKASARSQGGPWARDFGGRPGPGHWGGGFAGSRRTAWWPGPPSAQPPPKASRGDVRAAILALLQEGPRNGYQIMSEIEQRSGGAWRPSPGAVYPALAQLADEGLVTDEKSDGRRTYSLTDAGRAYVTANPDKARGAWESSQQQESWQIPGLFAEAARLGSGIVQLAHAGTPEQIRAAERLLEATRRELYRILAGDPSEDNDDEQDN